MSNPISRAIDTNLASLRVTDRDVDRIMERIRQDEQPRVRKLKLRYAIVLALLLALLTAGGTAAMLLSPREIISDEVLPMIEESENGLWLGENQVLRVLALARENGIELNERTLTSINEALDEYGGYWTERLIDALMYARYGMMSEWPQEDVTWFQKTINDIEAAYAQGRERDPIEGELNRTEAIARAKELVWEVYEDAPLDDKDQYYIYAAFFDGLTNGYYPGYYWSVEFVRQTIAVPEISLEFSADGQRLYLFDDAPGASQEATLRDVSIAFTDIYGQKEKWTQGTWREYVGYLKQIEANGEEIYSDIDRFIMQTEYPDIAPEAITPTEAWQIALEALTLQGNPNARVKSWIYMGGDPNPIWKITVQEARGIEGYDNYWNYFVEVDSITGEVKVIDESSSLYATRYMYVPHSTYLTTIPDIPNQAYPSVSAEKARMSVIAYLQKRYGETRDLNDTALFEVTVKEDFGFQYTDNIQWLVTFDARNVGEIGYWAYVDGFGNVLDAGVDNGAITSGHSLDSIRFEYDQVLDSVYTEGRFFELFMEDVRANADKTDPVVQLLLNTRYAGERDDYWAMLDRVQAASDKALGIRDMRVDDEGRQSNVTMIDANRPDLGLEGIVWKLAVRSSKGNYLIEVREDNLEVISVVELENIVEPWYASILLQCDMEDAGIAPEPYTRPVNNGLAIDEGCVLGMRLKHIFNRFCALYGPDPLGWSQAQLQSFQRAVAQSSSLGIDVGVACMQDTVYPSVPENAISREDAAAAGAQAMGLTGYEVDGAVLIGDAPNAVWKVCYRTADGYRYAEVDCMTGEVKATAERHELKQWYQDLVLEKIIEEHEQTFESTSYG